MFPFLRHKAQLNYTDLFFQRVIIINFYCVDSSTIVFVFYTDSVKHCSDFILWKNLSIQLAVLLYKEILCKILSALRSFLGERSNSEIFFKLRETITCHLLSLTKLIVSLDLSRSTVTNQMAFDQQGLHSTPEFKRTIYRRYQWGAGFQIGNLRYHVTVLKPKSKD